MAKETKKPAPDYRKVLDRLNQQSKRGGGGKDYLELEQGKNIVRILPAHPHMEAFYEEVYYHRRNVGKKSLSVICLNHGDSDGDDCPVCTSLEELRNSKDKTDRKLFGEQRPKPRFFMNAIDRKDNTLKILACGITIMKDVLGFVTDEEYGDILDPQEGTDLIITKSGEQLDTEYSTKARRNSSPALDDEDALSELIGTNAKNTKLFDLTEVKTQFEGEPDKVELVWSEGWEALKDLDDEDDEKPKKKKSVKPAAKKRKDEEDEEEDEDTEDEEEEAPKKKPQTKVKGAKPSRVVDDEDEDEEDEPKTKKKKKPEPEDEEEDEEEEPRPRKSNGAAPKKKSKPVEDEDEEEDLEDLDAILSKHKSKKAK